MHANKNDTQVYYSFGKCSTLMLVKIYNSRHSFFKVESSLKTMWAVDKDNTVWYKNEANLDKFLDREYHRRRLHAASLTFFACGAVNMFCMRR